MTKIFHRNIHGTLPRAVSAQGLFIQDQAGRQYLDACGGAAVSCLGHGHPEVLAAMQAQMKQVDYAHTSFFTTDVAEELAHLLVEHAPDGINHFYPATSGSEAIETALKMARQYFIEKGQPQRRHFLARRQSYHGNTLGALAVGGNAWRRPQFEPLLMEVCHVSPCYEYRDRRPGESSEAYGQRLVGEVEEQLQRLGPDTVLGICIEPVVGATLGSAPPAPGYLKGLRRLCDQYGILLIADEVMCGMGRTGSLHAVEQEDVIPDLMTIAKGLGGGYQAIGGVLVHDRVYEAFAQGSGHFMHGHTYLGHPVACAAALAVQKIVLRDGLVQASKVQGDRLRALLEVAFGSHPLVGDIRGRGLFQSIELVSDRETKTPFNPSLKVNARIRKAALEAGLMVYASSGTIDGVNGDHILLAPPFTVSSQDVELIVDRLRSAVDSALNTLG